MKLPTPATEPKVQTGPSAEPWNGAQLKSTMRFLAIPAGLGVLVTVFGAQLPSWLLYTAGAAIAFAVAIRSIKDPEWLVACLLLYLPISRVFVVPIAPGINGTNLLFIGLMSLWVLHARRNNEPLMKKLPNRRLVTVYAIITTLSVIPTILVVGADMFLEYGMEKYKSWIEQMLLYFAMLGMIRDGAMARRFAVYAMMSTVVSILFGAQEMIEKSGMSSIEKSRVLGPQYQPNEYGGFVVTNLCPFIALAFVYFPRFNFWWLMGVIGLGFKVLIATFSRGAMLGMAAALFVIGYLRGIKFLAAAAVAGIVIAVSFPQILPESISARFSQTHEERDSAEQLDKSSADRLILWQAAFQMIAESPLLGKGFGMFPYLKDKYTAVPVPVSDTHNMYLWIATQMGVPALLLFLLICVRMALMGFYVYRRHPEPFARAIGMACTAMVAGWMVINMFGSRMQSIETCALFWVYMAIVAHLDSEARKSLSKPANALVKAPAITARKNHV